MVDEAALNRRLEDFERFLRELPPSIAESFLPVVADLQQTIEDTIADTYYTKDQTNDLVAHPGAIAPTSVASSGAVSGSTVSASGAVSGASGAFASSLSSPGAYTTDVSALPGARQTVWQHNSGVYGFAPSTIEAKTNIGPVPFTADDVRAVSPSVFQYRAQLAIRDDPENEFYDPDYEVPWEIGLMAEDLIAHNMGMFVFFEPDGVTPKGINYDLFGAIAPLVLAQDVDRRLRAAGL